MVPSLWNAGVSLLSVSTVVSGLTPSSRSSFPNGTTSSFSTLPFDQALAARWCERAAHASCSSRLISSSLLTSSELSPMCCPVKVDHRPSWIIESTISVWPIRTPTRAFGSR